jgi:hypothetical protein
VTLGLVQSGKYSIFSPFVESPANEDVPPSRMLRAPIRRAFHFQNVFASQPAFIGDKGHETLSSSEA